MGRIGLATLVLVLPLAAHDPDPGKVPTRPATPPEEVAGAVLIVSYKDAPKPLPKVTRSKEEARARAEEALHEAREEGSVFDDVVAEFSDDPGNRGRLGVLIRGKIGVPALDEALFGMEIGQVSDIFESDFGFMIATRMTTRAHAAQILITYHGATSGSHSVTRSKEEARALAEEARRRVTEGKEEFAVVSNDLDETSLRESGGDMGIVPRGQLPRVLEDAVFALHPGEVSAVVETEFGFHVLKGARLDEALHWHACHILVAFQGAKDAPTTVTRTREEAQKLAEALLVRVKAGEDFGRLAAENSDCPSKTKGGNLGGMIRGQKDPAFEKAVLALAPGEVSGVVETALGFHIINRTE